MSGIKQVERKHLIRALTVSILFVVGIPMIIIGAINHKSF